MRLTTDLSRLAQNLSVIRGRIAPSVALILMVKADAYNHGSGKVSQFCETLVDGFGVATASEGTALRVAGISKPVLVTAPTVSEVGLFARYDLIPMVGSLELLQALAGTNTPIVVDIKVDSGFNRFGIKDYELGEAIATIKRSQLSVRALCTHFMCKGTAAMQTEKFAETCAIFEKEFGILKKHVASSFYVEDSPQYWYDEVRVGILAYGYGESLPVLPVLSVSAEIELVKKLKAGENVGYNALFTAEKSMNVGIVRAGYFDGIRRDMRGICLFGNGVGVRIIGAVSMDSFAVDLGNSGLKAHDLLDVLCDKRDARQLARELGTIPYEVLTMFRGRNERVFIR